MNLLPIKIISGGQTGVDRGALDAALALGKPCGGWCPAGRRSEDGTIASVYPLQETNSANYNARTRQNILDSDGTLVIYFMLPEGGTARTIESCQQLDKPYCGIDAARYSPHQALEIIQRFISEFHITTLNVAGPRASKQAQASDYARATITLLLQSEH